MNLMDFDDNWFLHRAFDAERRTRLLRWYLRFRMLNVLAALGAFLGAAGIAVTSDLQEEPWMVIGLAGLSVIGNLLLLFLVSLDGYIKTLKVVARLQCQTDSAPPTSNSVSQPVRP